MSTALSPEDLYRSPNALAGHYSRFRVDGRDGGRLLLTGHSHQAWPDRSLDGQRRAWEDAAEHADKKWRRAFEMGARVRAGYARWMGEEDASERYVLASNTHELLVRFLSALDLKSRPRLVTTDGEFHTIRRQLDRLAEEGFEIVRVPSHDPSTLAARLAEAIDDRTAAVLASTVLFRNARIVPGLGEALTAAQRHGAGLLVDTYHQLNVVPFSLGDEGLDGAYAVGGGYKYCQLGEGNAVLRVPEGCALRPVITGWYAEYAVLSEAGDSHVVAYGEGGARFAGATYDPTSHYRAASVLDFFDELGITPELLRTVSQHQVGLLAREFDALDADPAIVRRDTALDLREIGGFLVLQSPHAGRLYRELDRRGVLTDFRGDKLRLGPAPYLSDDQLRAAVACLGEVLRDAF